MNDFRLYWITMKYAVFRMKMPHAGKSANFLIVCPAEKLMRVFGKLLYIPSTNELDTT